MNTQEYVIKRHHKATFLQPFSIVVSFQTTIDTYDLAGVENEDYGRTWIVFPASGTLEIDQLYLYNGAHLALEPAVNPANADYSFTTEGFYGDGFVDASKLGTVHVGPYQTFTVRYSLFYGYPLNLKLKYLQFQKNLPYR